MKRALWNRTNLLQLKIIRTSNLEESSNFDEVATFFDEDNLFLFYLPFLI